VILPQLSLIFRRAIAHKLGGTFRHALDLRVLM
jgi:hypothetical protein